MSEEKDCAPSADSQVRKSDFAKTSAALYSHTLVNDNLLVQIDGDLSDDKAAAYERALQGLGGQTQHGFAVDLLHRQ